MNLHYLLDTNICIYIIKQKPLAVLRRFEQLSVGKVGLSIITYGELMYGAEKSQHTAQVIKKLNELIPLIPPLPLPVEAAACYGKIRHHLTKHGTPIGNNDLWIAAHALASGLVLVTNNIKEFKRIPSLRCENWAEELVE